MAEEEQQEEINEDVEKEEANEDILNKPVGTEERMVLTPQPVVIKKVEVRIPREGSKAQIAVFHCSHPEAKDKIGQDTIEISQVKAENMRTHKMEISGCWINKDSEGNLQKNSTLANFLIFLKAKNLNNTVGKTVQTVARENNFLSFKGY